MYELGQCNNLKYRIAKIFLTVTTFFLVKMFAIWFGMNKRKNINNVHIKILAMYKRNRMRIR